MSIYRALMKVADGVLLIAPNPTPTAKPSVQYGMQLFMKPT